MKSFYPKYLLLVSAIFILAITSCNKPKKLTSTRYSVIDSVNVLNDAQEDSIISLIDQLERNVGSQVAVLVIKDLKGKGINEYSISQAERFRLGSKEHDDGILITVSINDRTMRIEVGYGLERIIRDEVAARIIREVMAPKFRQGKYGQGIYNGVDTIKLLIEKNKSLVGARP